VPLALGVEVFDSDHTGGISTGVRPTQDNDNWTYDALAKPVPVFTKLPTPSTDGNVHVKNITVDPTRLHPITASITKNGSPVVSVVIQPSLTGAVNVLDNVYVVIVDESQVTEGDSFDAGSYGEAAKFSIKAEDLVTSGGQLHIHFNYVSGVATYTKSDTLPRVTVAKRPKTTTTPTGSSSAITATLTSSGATISSFTFSGTTK